MKRKRDKVNTALENIGRHFGQYWPVYAMGLGIRCVQYARRIRGNATPTVVRNDRSVMEHAVANVGDIQRLLENVLQLRLDMSRRRLNAPHAPDRLLSLLHIEAAEGDDCHRAANVCHVLEIDEQRGLESGVRLDKLSKANQVGVFLVLQDFRAGIVKKFLNPRIVVLIGHSGLSSRVSYRSTASLPLSWQSRSAVQARAQQPAPCRLSSRLFVRGLPLPDSSAVASVGPSPSPRPPQRVRSGLWASLSAYA